MSFRHFETRAQAKAYVESKKPAFPPLTIRKKHGKHKKPYAVATDLTHLHFTPDSWVRKTKRRH